MLHQYTTASVVLTPDFWYTWCMSNEPRVVKVRVFCWGPGGGGGRSRSSFDQRREVWEAGGQVILPSTVALVFCNDLEAAVLKAAPDELPGLRQAGAVYRADPLFEAVADLSDLVWHEQGRLGEDVVRLEASGCAGSLCYSGCP